jgi:hypothetical protein
LLDRQHLAAFGTDDLRRPVIRSDLKKVVLRWLAIFVCTFHSHHHFSLIAGRDPLHTYQQKNFVEEKAWPSRSE